MQAPQRFSRAFRAAVEAKLPALASAVLRCRFHFRETGSVPATVETLDKVGARGSHGVIAKAPNTDLSVMQPKKLKTKHHNERHAAHVQGWKLPLAVAARHDMPPTSLFG